MFQVEDPELTLISFMVKDKDRNRCCMNDLAYIMQVQCRRLALEIKSNSIWHQDSGVQVLVSEAALQAPTIHDMCNITQTILHNPCTALYSPPRPSQSSTTLRNPPQPSTTLHNLLALVQSSTLLQFMGYLCVQMLSIEEFPGGSVHTGCFSALCLLLRASVLVADTFTCSILDPVIAQLAPLCPPPPSCEATSVDLLGITLGLL